MRRHPLQSRLIVQMASIAFLAVGLASLKHPYQPWISIVLTMTIATLLASALQAHLALTPGARAWWFGFSLFGWTHLLLIGSQWNDSLPASGLITWLVQWCTIHYGPYPTPGGRGPWYTNAIHEANGRFCLGILKLTQLYLTLIVACGGAILTWSLATRRGEQSATAEEPENLGHEQ